MTLDKLIAVYREVRTQRPDLSFDVQRIKVCSAMARVSFGGGSERVAGDQLQADNTVQFTIHHRGDLLESDVIHWNGKDHNIRRILDMQQGDIYLKVIAEQGVAV